MRQTVTVLRVPFSTTLYRKSKKDQELASPDYYIKKSSVMQSFVFFLLIAPRLRMARTD
jgi:hypothetical protein